MNLLADESVDKPIVDGLRQDGHNVYIAELDPSIDDDTVLRRANEAGALLITLDKDFGELVFRQGRVHAGVVLIRLAGLSPQAKARIVSTVFANRGGELLNAFSVISPGTVRVRRSQPPNDNARPTSK
ncbi:MAG: DUF5615 family PIN-like protein [Candidatus Poribacteria bacterium]|nr:DUF5615 family PIN-like protein [Candidatus Poribacteria bacterium]